MTHIVYIWSLEEAPGGLVIDGQWSEWDPWSSCSATCDGGTQRRVRRCDDPAPQNGGPECVGVSSENRPCDEWMCPGMSQSVTIVVVVVVFRVHRGNNNIHDFFRHAILQVII